ncbi:S41 family peptidase [Frigoriflavimonas asaccharolytica]|uniref:C-terminal processing protease CtpA/Prc n=1 Tax=Frigoriflavimonas asaccharolytica TaxID=2735899 RepID=A0A8J8G8T6_9FLAO|nr:S41 family peptidase [Frigoriflavimonas asaccharolytica]NRS92810.1 C-terminal processing protease CtpA/Prc [Frigoriflavimonas asaccharolytica]
MKKIYYFLLVLLLSSCISVKKYNEQLLTKIPVEKLKKDVNFTYKKLQKNHPDLYGFTSKENLDFKFDSLKFTIKSPLNPSEFYQKLAPLITEVQQGHLNLMIPAKRLTKKEIKNLEKQKGLFSRYNFILDGDKIFVKDNADKIENMDVGTEILEINEEKSSILIEKYKPYIASDGYNTSYEKYALSRRWPTFFTVENGILDSVKLKVKFNNEIKIFYLKREPVSKKEKKAEKIYTKKKEEQKTQDYNPNTRSYNRSIDFKTKDSSVVLMTIKTFSGVKSKSFYKESFQTLSDKKVKYLILDLRNNLGGSLAEIHDLYRYLGADKYPFITDIEVTDSASLLRADYFSSIPWLAKPLAAITYPFYAFGSLLSVKKKDGQILLRNNLFSSKKPRKNAFEGEIYVLINGSSFSASSIISSKLKGDGRAILVGEETGGANDGTVAGRYNTVKLPNSKILFPIGLMKISPNIVFTKTKKGVEPNIEMIESTTEILQKKDKVLHYVLEEISKKNSIEIK